MFKRVAFLILSISILSIVGLAVHDYYFYHSFLSEFRIHDSFDDFDNYPYIRWGDITSGKLSRYLNNQNKKGWLSTFSENVKAFSNFTFLSDMLYNDRGINYPSPQTNGEYTSSGDKTVLPYKFVAFFRTGLARKNYLVLIQRIKNIDGTEIFIPLITNREMLLTDSSPNRYYSYLSDPSLNNFPSPVMDIKDEILCKKTYPNFKEYCVWYSKNKNIQNKSRDITEVIKKYSTFSNESQTIPYLIKLVVLN